ncbi:MAG: hypothetical protein VB082_02135 [Christensenella sp.]|nr:hypothetical protein [Christensenella sp.]
MARKRSLLMTVAAILEFFISGRAGTPYDFKIFSGKLLFQVFRKVCHAGAYRSLFWDMTQTNGTYET